MKVELRSSTIYIPPMNSITERIVRKTIRQGDCLLWQGATVHGTPVLKSGGKLLSVRRVVAGGEGYGYVKPSCGQKLCVAEKHLVRTDQVKERILHLVGHDDPDQCWIVPNQLKIRFRAHRESTSPRRAAYVAYKGAPETHHLRMACQALDCINPFHVLESGLNMMVVEEESDISFCAFLICGRTDRNTDNLEFDQPTIDAAIALAKERGDY
jgi:hypothetical protein